jgi:hypothetical protein
MSTLPLANKQNSYYLEKTVVKKNRPYPDTETGRQQYQKDLTAWSVLYGEEARAAFTCEYLPLTPGTVILGSQECYSCGTSVATTWLEAG